MSLNGLKAIALHGILPRTSGLSMESQPPANFQADRKQNDGEPVSRRLPATANRFQWLEQSLVQITS
jgi:hypothetical protein